MPLCPFVENAGIDEFVDPEIDNALLFDIQEADHFGKGGHAAMLPEEGGNGSLDGLDGSFLFHGSHI
jgi:hypothetical protein